LWERPDQFLPERFLDADDQHKFSYFPFGGGLHNCIGRHFAELEMLLVITVLWKKFHFETITDAKEAIGITLKPDRVIMSRVSSRGL
jgi:cytochrome P450